MHPKRRETEFVSTSHWSTSTPLADSLWGCWDVWVSDPGFPNHGFLKHNADVSRKRSILYNRSIGVITGSILMSKTMATLPNNVGFCKFEGAENPEVVSGNKRTSPQTTISAEDNFQDFPKDGNSAGRKPKMRLGRVHALGLGHIA